MHTDARRKSSAPVAHRAGGDSPATSRRYVIVGGVAGGMSAATRLRRRDEHAEIIVLERGEHVSFANCGLPYYAGGVIEDREALLLQTPQSLFTRFRLDVRVGQEVVAIDTDAHEVTVARSTHVGPVGEDSPSSPSEPVYQLTYDRLLLAPGATPLLPPVAGIERALTLRNVADVDRLVESLKENPRTAVILGGGFIGVEVAENLHARGLGVTLVEAAPQILSPLDEEMAAFVDNHMTDMGITVLTGVAASAITEDAVELADGRVLAADLVLAATGVRPDTALAAAAGIDLDDRGAIIVDEQHQTSAADVFAVGDAVAKRDRLDGGAVHVPLANSANRDGRTVADIMAGRTPITDGSDGEKPDGAQPEGVMPGGITSRVGVLGTAIVGIGGLVAAATGWNERTARARGVDYATIYTHPFDHATYYPGAQQMHIKLVYTPDTGKILGAQVVGSNGVDKRIDVLATAIAGNLSVYDLAGIDLAYAPPFGLAKDPVTMLGFVADNQDSGLSTTIDVASFERLLDTGCSVLDVRTPGEFAAGHIPGAINYELDSLREHLDDIAQLPQPLVVHCAVGVRGHTATCLLAGYGIPAVNLAGGYVTYAALAAKRQRGPHGA